MLNFLLWTLLVPVQMGWRCNEGHLSCHTYKASHPESWPKILQERMALLIVSSLPFRKDGTIQIFFQLFHGLEEEREKAQCKFRAEKGVAVSQGLFLNWLVIRREDSLMKTFCTIKEMGEGTRLSSSMFLLKSYPVGLCKGTENLRIHSKRTRYIGD